MVEIKLKWVNLYILFKQYKKTQIMSFKTRTLEVISKVQREHDLLLFFVSP